MPKDKDFNNNEIMLMFEKVELKLNSILEQTTKHNGRMSAMEKRLTLLENLRYVLYGSVMVVMYLGIPKVLSILS